MRIIRGKNSSPEILVLTLNEITSLKSVKSVLVGDLDELVVAVTPGALVSSVGEMGIALLAILSDNLGVVELIVDQEVLRVIVGVNDDLGEGIVKSGSLVSFLDTSIKPGFKGSEFISLLKFLNELLDRAIASDIVKNLLNVVLVTLEVDKGSQDLRSSVRVDLEEINFDEFVEVVLEEVFCQLIDETVDIAKVDEGSGIRKLNFLKEVLDLDGIVEFSLSDDSLDFSELVALSGSLDELEIEVGILRVGENIGEEEIDSVESSDTLEDLDDCSNVEFLEVGCGNSDNKLNILTRVSNEFLEALENPVRFEFGHIVDEEIRREDVSVEDDSLDILDVSIVFKSTLQESLLLAQRSDLGSIVLVPDLHLEDGLSNVRSHHQIELKNLGLPGSILGSIVSHAINEESGEFLNSVEREENLCNAMDIDRLVLGHEGFSNLKTSFGLRGDDVLEESDVVGSETGLVGE
jgi:hypothetical protein